MSNAWLDRLAQRPEIFPHQLDLINDQLLLVELPKAKVEAASFLDQRVLSETTQGAWIPWQEVTEVIDPTPVAKPVSLVFHVGHCGSTLLSRLAGFAGNTQSLREPLPLRSLAQDFADADEGRSFVSRKSHLKYLKTLSKLWSRGASHTVIKATSICTDLLPVFQSAEPSTRSIFVFNRVETHIATLLAGENAVVDLKGFAKLRIQRLRQKTDLDIRLSELNLGQLAALSWLSETTSATQSLEAFPGQIEALEFETLIATPADSLARVLDFLKIPASESVIESAVQSSVMQTYSKAPEVQYNAQTRAAILAQSRSTFGAEIKAALMWLDELANQCELVSTSMRQFG